MRTTGDPSAIAPSVRAALREIDPGQPLVNVRTMETAMAGTVAQPRLQMILLMVFAGVAVALAIVGVYGVMAYTVSQRVAEIGVRMAIGASPGNVVGMVVRQGAVLAAAGIVIGLGGRRGCRTGGAEPAVRRGERIRSADVCRQRADHRRSPP